MEIASNILKYRLKNIYFIWGSGKTTIANALAEKYGCFVYHTDYERAKHFHNADPQYQPALCRNVPDYWALDPDDAKQWEQDIVREFTPMVVADLLALAPQHQYVICEGDIDIDLIMPVATHVVTISNYGTAYDFFDRPDQQAMLQELQQRPDLSDAERERLIQNAYAIVGQTSSDFIPYETQKYGVKQIIRYDDTTIKDTANMVAAFFGWNMK